MYLLQPLRSELAVRRRLPPTDDTSRRPKSSRRRMSGLECTLAADVDPAGELVNAAAASRLKQDSAHQQLRRPNVRPSRPRTHPNSGRLDEEMAPVPHNPLDLQDDPADRLPSRHASPGFPVTLRLKDSVPLLFAPP
jgi:hypothetical protein